MTEIPKDINGKAVLAELVKLESAKGGFRSDVCFVQLNKSQIRAISAYVEGLEARISAMLTERAK